MSGGASRVVHHPTVGRVSLPRDDHFIQTDGNVSGTQVQTTDACSLQQKCRVEQPSRKWRTKRFCNTKWRVSVVSYEFAKEGPRRTDGTREVVPHPNVVDARDELARRFSIRASAREALERHAASEAIRRTTIWDPRP